MSDLAGKVALVTGGSRGIGAAIAKRLAAEGANVALTYVSAKDKADDVVAQIEATGRRGLAISADVADPEAVTDAVSRTVTELGRLDILVNNAGIWSNGPFEDVSLDELNRLLDVHVRAAFIAAQAASPHLESGSRIITISSSLAERVAQPGVTLYSMTKAALTGLTKGLANDLGPRGITVNQVNPGSTDTDMNPADGAHSDAQRAGIPLGHYGTADDVAATVAHLAGPGGRYITGASIAVDGGSTT